MNIFVLDKDPMLAAKYHCDKHIVKMILESAQLLCSAHWVSGSQAKYRLTHKNHPCSIWVRESIENYDWMCYFSMCLCMEYTSRYGKTHKSQETIEWCCINKPNLNSTGVVSDHPLCMPEKYKSDDVVTSYRSYYLGEKMEFAKWSKSEKPPWVTQVVDTELEKSFIDLYYM